MDMEFSRQRLAENITALMQQKKLRVGDVEQQIGISTGYLSKMLKKDTDAAPSTDIIWKLAKVLGVSTDMLIEGDFTKATDNIQYLANFFTRLKVMTDSNELEWRSIKIDDVDDSLRGKGEKLPIIAEDRTKSAMGSDDPNFYQNQRVSHCSYGCNYIYSDNVDADVSWVRDTAYCVGTDYYTYLYIFPMCCKIGVGEDGLTEDIDYFDVYFGILEPPEGYGDVDIPDDVMELHFEQVCNTFKTGRGLEDVLSLLYQSIARHEYDLRISLRVKERINQFMYKDDPDNMPF